MSIQNQLHTVLTDLDGRMPAGAFGSLIASSDGFLVTTTLREGDAEHVSAMVATTVGVSRRMTKTLEAGDLSETRVAGSERQMLLYLVGSEGVLAVVAKHDANIALINIAAREAAEKARQIMDSVGASPAGTASF
jgi:hypothetical protein